MERFYLINDVRWRLMGKTSGLDYLRYYVFLRGNRGIPFVIVEKDNEYFEFFTKTKFYKYSECYGAHLDLPESTLRIYSGSSNACTYSEISPERALELIEPHMKYSQRCIAQMNLCLDWYKRAYEAKENKRIQQDQRNEDSRTKLLKYWDKH